MGVQIANETLSYPSPSYLLPDGPVLAESVHSVNLYDHPVRTTESEKVVNGGVPVRAYSYSLKVGMAYTILSQAVSRGRDPGKLKPGSQEIAG